MPSERPSVRLSARGGQTRDQLLSSALFLFTDRGYHQASVNDVIEHAGIGKGAFFYHWKTKEDLALEICERMRAVFEEQFFSQQLEVARSRDKIERLLRRITELNIETDEGYMRLFSLWVAELNPAEEKIGPAVHALKLRWCAMWNELIRAAQAERDLRADISPENLSFLVVSAISGVQLMRKTEADRIQARTAYETLRRALLT